MKVTEAPHDALKGKNADSCTRVLLDVTDGQMYRVHTTPVDSGGQCEVLAGETQGGEALVFRQFRALPPTQRDHLLSGLRRPRVTSPRHVAADVAMARAAGGPCAPRVFLRTYRDHQVSKLYVGLRPMHADLLGCARTLQDQGASPALRVAFTCWVLAQLAQQLADLHAQGIVHRDLRLDNVLCGPDEDGAVCVNIADFGNARGPGVEALARPTGPLPYCAPEVLQGSYDGDFTPRDSPQRDVWALGIVSIILLLGENPFDPDCDFRDNEAIANTLLAYALPGGPRLPLALEDFGLLGGLVRRMLRRDPQRRPTAAQVRDELQLSGLLEPAAMQRAAAFAATQQDLRDVIESRLEDLRP